MKTRSCHTKQYTLSDAQRQRVEENYALIPWTLNRYFQIRPDEWEDLMQIGAIGLCRAAYEYTPEKNISFATYAVPCIRTHISQYFIHQKRQKHDPEKELLILDACVSKDGSEERSLADFLEDPAANPEEIVAANLDAQALLRQISGMPLSARERAVVFRRLQGESFSSIAAALGLSRSRTGRIFKAARGRICHHLSASPQQHPSPERML
ncbi:MAG: sigma-70 family RNA polymerase sigma factor [Clostridia bacterium]|nr:sigma-70 family RNA polymerase sigma factor [Clostridia bacterium]